MTAERAPTTAVSTRRLAVAIVALLGVAAVAALFWLARSQKASDEAGNARGLKIVYGLSPYQDTIIPQYAKIKGWYAEEGLDIDTKVLAWGDVMPALGGGGVDVALQNFNSFQATYWNLRDRGVDPVFYYVMYVFRGAAIIIAKDSPLKTVSELQAEGKPLDEAVRTAATQLKGKKIAATAGTEMEQVVLAALKVAGLAPKTDATIIHVQPDEALAAFLGGSVDTFSAGVPEHTEAARHGARILLSADHVLPPVLDGIVTTRPFAEKHSDVLEKLVDVWFRTIRHLNEDMPGRTPILIDYLSSVAATKYTVKEYEYVMRTLHVLPMSRAEVGREILNPNGRYYWRRSWDANNEFLHKTDKIPRPVPPEAFIAGVAGG